MIFALAKFSAYYEDFNRRPLTEKDGFYISELENVELVFCDLPILLGCHTIIDGKSYIYIDKNLSGIKLLFILFHELAHVILHGTKEKVSINFYNQFEGRQENEAEAIALVALFPTECLPELENFQTDDEFLADLVVRRLLIKELYGV